MANVRNKAQHQVIKADLPAATTPQIVAKLKMRANPLVILWR